VFSQDRREIGGRVLGEVSKAENGRSSGDCCRKNRVAVQREMQRGRINGLLEENRTRVLDERRKEERAEECDARPMRAKN